MHIQNAQSCYFFKVLKCVKIIVLFFCYYFFIIEEGQEKWKERKEGRQKGEEEGKRFDCGQVSLHFLSFHIKLHLCCESNLSIILVQNKCFPEKAHCTETIITMNDSFQFFV